MYMTFLVGLNLLLFTWFFFTNPLVSPLKSSNQTQNQARNLIMIENLCSQIACNWKKTLRAKMWKKKTKSEFINQLMWDGMNDMLLLFSGHIDSRFKNNARICQVLWCKNEKHKICNFFQFFCGIKFESVNEVEWTNRYKRDANLLQWWKKI